MDAQAFADLNDIIRQLDSRISNARFGDDRGGMVRPSEMAGVVQSIRDALATMDMVQAKSLPLAR